MKFEPNRIVVVNNHQTIDPILMYLFVPPIFENDKIIIKLSIRQMRKSPNFMYKMWHTDCHTWYNCINYDCEISSIEYNNKTYQNFEILKLN